MARTLLTRRWIAALLAATLLAVAFFFLGRWQWGRHLDKSHRAELVAANYDAAPVPLDTALPRGDDALPDGSQWRRVSLEGVYDANAELMVRNRPRDGVYGWEQLVPLRLPDGTAILVDRGWVPNAQAADVVPRVSGPPPGRVRVIGRLRPGEEAVESGLPRGILASIDVSAARGETGLDLRPAYVDLQSEDDGSGRAPARPAPLLPPDTGTGPHLAYAIQWWAGMPAGFVFVLVFARREWLESTGEAARREAERAARPKKVRIWDEEDA